MKGITIMPQNKSWSAIDERIKEVRGKKTLDMPDYRPRVSPRKSSKKELTHEQIKQATEEYLERGGTIRKVDEGFDLNSSSIYLEDN